jgi:hypothetical protein
MNRKLLLKQNFTDAVIALPNLGSPVLSEATSQGSIGNEKFRLKVLPKIH